MTEKELDRYFELEQKQMENTMTEHERKEWEAMHVNLDLSERITATMLTDDQPEVSFRVKSKLDDAFHRKHNDIRRHTIFSLPAGGNVRSLWQAPSNWAAVASVAALLAISFFIQPKNVETFDSGLLADSSFHNSVDTSAIQIDSALY